MKVALVTGSSRGIGAEIVRKLHNDGFTVCINYSRNEELAFKLLEEINNDGFIYKCNVASYEETEDMIKEIINRYQKIDVIVNNAGITKDNLMLKMSEEDFDKVIDINLKGTFNVIKHASRYMLKARTGKIINMSSIVGIKGNLGQANYAASKGGIIALTKSLAQEFAPRGITVNAIAPGFIKTEMTDVLSDEIKDKILENIPLKRLGDTKDVANLVSFLASDNASYITGQVISIDGGMAI